MALSLDANSKISALERKLAIQQKFEEINSKIFSSLNIDEILIHIMNEASTLVGCDRCTVFVVDREQDEIFSKVMQGDEVKEIRVPITSSSIAGYVATSGRVVNIKNVYDEAGLKTIHPDLQFDSSWDKKTGYTTKTVLAGPIRFKEETTGLIQLINKKEGFFTTFDEGLLEKLAHFASLALNNAKSHHNLTSRYMKRRSLSDMLIDKGLLTESTMQSAEEEARQANVRVENILRDKYHVPDSDIAQCEAELFNMKFVKFGDTLDFSVNVADTIKEEVAKRYKFLPLRIYEKNGKPALQVVMRNPRDPVLKDNIEITTGIEIGEYLMATDEDIERMIPHYFGGGGREMEETEKLDSVLDEIKDMGALDVDMVDVKEGAKETETPITKLVDKIILEAYKAGASDIHIEGFQTYVRVRYRKDGALYEAFRFPKHAQKAASSRLKIISKLDISERRKPQSGRIKFSVGPKKQIELRVEVLPTISEEEDESNEDIVMRILAGGSQVDLDKVGFSPMNMENFKALVEKPYGLVLVVGPTGSGKTTTLYSGINYINDVETKILTAEDPVEIRLDGVRQVAVVPKIGYTFAAALRSFLRCDPNVVLIGEMRDLETAEIGVKAALTGHLVFSTLHTNNAPATITRLVDMGINPFNLADSLLTVLAQRLGRRLCSACKEAFTPDQKELAYMGLRFENGTIKCSQFEWDSEQLKSIGALDSQGRVVLYRPKGCGKCGNKGMKGRVAIHEMLVMKDAIKSLLYKGCTIDELRAIAIKTGMVSLFYDGIQKVLQGITTYEEVRGECGDADEVDLISAKKAMNIEHVVIAKGALSEAEAEEAAKKLHFDQDKPIDTGK